MTIALQPPEVTRVIASLLPRAPAPGNMRGPSGRAIPARTSALAPVVVRDYVLFYGLPAPDTTPS